MTSQRIARRKYFGLLAVKRVSECLSCRWFADWQKSSSRRHAMLVDYEQMSQVKLISSASTDFRWIYFSKFADSHATFRYYESLVQSAISHSNQLSTEAGTKGNGPISTRSTRQRRTSHLHATFNRAHTKWRLLVFDPCIHIQWHLAVRQLQADQCPRHCRSRHMQVLTNYALGIRQQLIKSPVTVRCYGWQKPQKLPGYHKLKRAEC